MSLDTKKVLENLYNESVEMTLGIAKLDEQVGIKRTDYKGVHAYSVKTVMELESKKAELQKKI